MNKLTIILLIAVIASASASVHFWRQLDEEREQRAALQTRIAELEEARPVVAATQSVPEPEAAPSVGARSAAPTVPNRSPPQAMIAAVGPGPAVASSRLGVADAEMRQRMMDAREQQLRMLKDPEYRELMRTQQKHGMYQMYADLEPRVGLTKDESERLLDVLAEQSLRNMEEQQPMFASSDGSPPSETEIRERQRMYEEQRRKNDAEVAAVLGPKFDEWQAYQKNSWSRMQVTQLRQALSTTDEPLRQEQMKPLVEAIAREQQHIMTPMRSGAINTRPDAASQARMAEEWLERTAQSHERVRTAVQGLLSPSQFEQLQRQQQQALKMQELNARQQRARADAQARGEIPPDSPPGVFGSSVTFSSGSP